MKYISVINTINRSKNIVERSLRAIITQQIKPLKIILVDQNETALVLPDEIKSNPLIEVTRVNKKSISEARNSITVPAGTDYIFFCDDDGYACDDYSETLQNLINKFPDLGLQITAVLIIKIDICLWFLVFLKNPFGFSTPARPIATSS